LIGLDAIGLAIDILGGVAATDIDDDDDDDDDDELDETDLTTESFI